MVPGTAGRQTGSPAERSGRGATMTMKLFGAALAGALMWAVPAMAGKITLYDQEGYRGQSVTIRSDVDNLDRYPPWNDRARSLVVHSGTWEVCRHAGYQKCRTLGPGASVANLGEVKNLGEISSLRELQAHARHPARDDRGWDDRRWDDRGWGDRDRRWDDRDRRWDDRDRRWDDRDDRGWGDDGWRRPPPPQPRRPWDDGGITWDDGRGRDRDWDRGGNQYAMSGCQQQVYSGFVDRFGYKAKANFSGTPTDGTIWWEGRPWRYRCAGGQVNIWQ